MRPGGDSTLIRRVCATGVLNLSPCSGVGKPKKDTLLWSYRSFLKSIVLYCIVSYRIVSYHISYRIVSYRIVSYRIVSYRIVSYRIASHRIVSYRIVSYRIVSYCIALHCIALETNIMFILYLLNDSTIPLQFCHICAKEF